MSAYLINEDDLKAWLKYDRRADIEKILRKNHIPVILGKNGEVCTTLQAINGTILGPGSKLDYEFD